MIKYTDEGGKVLLSKCERINITTDSYEKDGKKWFVPAKSFSDMAHYPMFTNEVVVKFDSPYEIYGAIEQFDEESGIWRAHLIAARPDNYEPGRIKMDPAEVEFENYAMYGEGTLKLDIDGKVFELNTGGLGEAAVDPGAMDAMAQELISEKVQLGKIICTCASLSKEKGESLEFFDMILAFSGKVGYMKEMFPQIIESITGKTPEKINEKSKEEQLERI